MATQAEKAIRFRALHQRNRAFVMPNPWDAGSARLLAGLGFEALATTSSGFANTLGRRDGEVSLAECVDHCRELCAATDLPVSVDLENGFGDSPAAVAEAIARVAEVGVVGGSIEDWSGGSAGRIYSQTEAVERVQAAVEAVRSLPFPFTLTARAENLLHGRQYLDDTIRRLQAFEAAGADVLYAPGLRTLDEVKAVTGSLEGPVNVLAPMVAGATVADLAAAGARRLSVGGALARAAQTALLAAGRELVSAGGFGWCAALADGDELDDLLAGGPDAD
ncbi:MAG: isocitrate lyase/phosphoenolpyruvate mutase family protein [Acidobacteriota bacterium]